MKVKKIPMKGYDAYTYKTDKYTTIHIDFLFEMDYTKENIYKCDLLEEYMMHTNAIYKTKREIDEKIRTYYSMGLRMTNYNVGKKMFIEINYTLFDPKLVKDNYLSDALEFAHDMLYKPNFVNGKLDAETLKVCKNNMISSHASTLVEPKYKAKIGFTNTVFPNSYLTEDIIETKEEYEKMLNNCKDQDLIDMYHKILDESFVGLTIMGNFDEEFLDNVKRLFKFKTVKAINTDYDGKVVINDKDEFIKVCDREVNESIVYGVYDIKKYDIKKKYVYEIISLMLNTHGRVMHKVLRDELKLVYTASASFNSRAEFFVLNALIDRSNINKCVEGFDMILDKLNDKTYVEELLSLVKKQVNISDYVSDENKWNMNDDLFKYAFKTTDSRKRRNEIINKITPDEVIEAVNNLERKVVYFYEGAKDEK